MTEAEDARPSARMSRRAALGLGAVFGAVAFVPAGCTPSGEPPPPVPEPSGAQLEPYRPAYHYSPSSGRLADPNGLFWWGGTFHLFHQSDGRWAHASSPDLLHWRRLPIALDHDEHGQALSGSAVVDRANRSGLFTDAAGGVAAVYTSTTGGEAQCLATSADYGTTWTRFRGNPVLPNDGRRDFRDPKVIWHGPSSRWVMLLAAGERVDFYASTDLRNWTFLSTFGDGQGLHTAVWECVGQPPPDPRRLRLGEEEPEAFLDRPRGLDLFGRIAAVEGSPQPLPLLGRQMLSTGEQHGLC